MKRGKYILGLLCAGLMACTADSFVSDESSGLEKGKELEQIIFNFPDLEYDSPQTRAVYLDEERGLTFHWQSSDTVGIFSSTGSQVAFPMLNGTGGSNTAIFDGNGWGLLAGKTYMAYYPYNYYNRSADGIAVDYSNQTQYSMSTYPSMGNRGLCEHDYMYSDPTTPTNNTLKINLMRLNAIVKVDVDLSELTSDDISPSGLVIEEAILHRENSYFGYKGFLQIGGSFVWKTSGRYINLKILEPSVLEGNVASFYFSVKDDYSEIMYGEVGDTYTLTFKAAGGYKYVVPLGEVEESFDNGMAYRLTGIAKNASNYITNPKLVAAIKDVNSSITTNSDGWIDISANKSKLEAIKEINLYWKHDPHICDEIGALKGLETLYCGHNEIEYLDLSKLTELKYLDVSNNILTELDLSSNKKLESLICNYNKLTYLDLSNNTSLWYLNCISNQLTHLDIRSILDCFYCSYNKIQSITTNQQQVSLYLFDCSHNQIHDLNDFIQGASSIEKLICGSNKLTNLDLSGLTSLNFLDCSDNQIGEYLNLCSTAITTLKCQKNNIRYIQVNGQTKGTRLLTQLSTLWAYENVLDVLYIDGLTSLDITGEGFQVGRQKGMSPWVIIDSKLYKQIGNVYSPDYWNNGIVWKYETIDYITNSNLKAAILGEDSSITTDSDGDIPVANNKTRLETITSINVGNKEDPNCCDEISVLTGLQALNCYTNGIRSLDVTKLTNLKMLNCFGNELTVLNITRNTNLEKLDCEVNNLTYLNLNFNTHLKTLYCGSNRLSYLSLPSSLKTTLQELGCDYNEITQLNVTGFTALTNLYCQYNQMTYLDIRTCTSLRLNNVTCGAQSTATGESRQLTLHYMWNQGGTFNSSDPENENVVLMQDDSQD